MHVERAQQRSSIACLATPTARTMPVCLETLRGTAIIQEVKHMPLAAKPPMRLVCTTCQAMCGSGVMIGISNIYICISILEEYNPPDPRKVGGCPSCCAAAAGSSAPTTAARRPETPSFSGIAAASTASASVSRGLRSFLYPC